MATTDERTVAGAATVPLRRNRDFNLMWSGGTLSDLGSYTSLLAVPLLVLAITGSPAQAGTVTTLAAVIRGLARLPGGALADRWNRRTLMLVSDLARMVLFAGLALAVYAEHVSLLLVIVVVGAAALFDVLFSPAELAAISRVVPREQLPDAFARNEARSYGAALAGPPLGGLLYGLGRAVPFAFDAFSYLVSFVAVATIRQPFQGDRSETPAQNVVKDITEGVRHVLRDPFLRAFLLVSAPLNFAVTGALFTMTVTLRQSGISAGMIGVAQGIIGVGGFFGALAAPRIQRRASLRLLVVSTNWALLVCLAIAGLLTGHLVMAVPITIGLFLSPAANAALFGHLGATTPTHLQARVVSVVFLIATTAASVAPLVTGVLIQHVGGATAMELCAVAVAGSSIAATASRGMRHPTRANEA